MNSKSSNDLLMKAFQSSPRGTPRKSPVVINRAIELGMNPDDELDINLIWIAEKSLQNNLNEMVLPNGWVECYTEEGYKYYWSEENSESCWINPNLLSYQKLFEKLKSEAVLSRLAMGGGSPSPSPKKQAWSESNVINGDFNEDVSPQNDMNAYDRKKSSPREFKIEKNDIEDKLIEDVREYM
jgi:hypothetical protein